ncbi:MAG: hypothetical protein ACK4TA_23070 [Saprospiraceae bacterium]
MEDNLQRNYKNYSFELLINLSQKDIMKLVKKVVSYIQGAFFVFIVIIGALAALESSLLFSHSSKVKEAYVYEVANTAARGGCTIYYFYFYLDEMYQGIYSQEGTRCEGNFYKGQVFTVEIAKLDPSRSRLNVQAHLTHRKVNIDSLYQIYLVRK